MLDVLRIAIAEAVFVPPSPPPLHKLFPNSYVGSVAHLKPSVVVEGGKLEYSEIPREGVASSIDYVTEMSTGRGGGSGSSEKGEGGAPYLRLLSPHGPSGTRVVDNELTRRYLDALKSVCAFVALFTQELAGC